MVGHAIETESRKIVPIFITTGKSDKASTYLKQAGYTDIRLTKLRNKMGRKQATQFLSDACERQGIPINMDEVRVIDDL
jgi:hypothetical protein